MPTAIMSTSVNVDDENFGVDQINYDAIADAVAREISPSMVMVTQQVKNKIKFT